MDYKDYCELYHHGIKGQKWGVRRFQNEDGTLTSAGKKRRTIRNVIKDNKYKKMARIDAAMKYSYDHGIGLDRLIKPFDKKLNEIYKERSKESSVYKETFDSRYATEKKRYITKKIKESGRLAVSAALIGIGLYRSHQINKQKTRKAYEIWKRGYDFVETSFVDGMLARTILG